VGGGADAPRRRPVAQGCGVRHLSRQRGSSSSVRPRGSPVY
jgi:hypothetical protein